MKEMSIITDTASTSPEERGARNDFILTPFRRWSAHDPSEEVRYSAATDATHLIVPLHRWRHLEPTEGESCLV